MREVKFKPNMTQLEYSMYLAYCLYMGIEPKKYR